MNFWEVLRRYTRYCAAAGERPTLSGMVEFAVQLYYQYTHPDGPHENDKKASA